MDSSYPQPSTTIFSGKDGRRYPRCTAQVQIEVHPEGSDVPMCLETADLSRGGCYVRLTTPMPVGISLHVTLRLGGDPLVIRGRVVTRHPQFGNGIAFVDFEGQAEVLLNRYLEAVTS